MKNFLKILVYWGTWVGAMMRAVSGLAWEPHREITQAALAVLPERERWERLLGKENLQHVLVDCSMLPDLCYPFMAAAQWQEVPEVINTRPLKTFYADDYVLIRALPRRIGHSTGELLQHALEAHYPVSYTHLTLPTIYSV